MLTFDLEIYVSISRWARDVFPELLTRTSELFLHFADKKILCGQISMHFYVVIMAVARILFHPRRRDSTGARLLLCLAWRGWMVGRGHMV